MQVNSVTLSMKELQDALLDYCEAHSVTPAIVIIASYNKQIVVELAPNGLITCDEFKHRVQE